MSGETGVWDDDYMDRQPSSEFLTKYILANEHVKVLNVNSPWGAGKTFFLNHWKNDLSKEHVCVMFNAWETDYSAEPLLALITCIEQQTKDELDITATEAGQRAVNLSANILRKAAPLIAKGLVKKFVGVELDELLGKDGGDNLADGTKDLVSSLIEDQSKTAKHVNDFKAAVVERLKTAAENNALKAPAFIFIDELDRCRPTYAIELLERIKHFFELDDCRFIIASDSKQLAHSIRAVYGQGFSSEKYLNRFFDAEFNLDNSNIFNMVNRCLPDIPAVSLGINIAGQVTQSHYHDEEAQYPKKNTVMTGISGFTENQIIVVGLCKYFKVELRELTNYVKQIKSAADTIGGNVQFFWLAYLIFFKASKAEEYSDLWISGKWKQAIDGYDESKADAVTFLFAKELASVKEIAVFYLTMLNSSREELRALRDRAESWRETIFYSTINGNALEVLKSYKEVVELAHRLS